MGFGVWGLGVGVLGFGVWGLGFGVWGLGRVGHLPLARRDPGNVFTLLRIVHALAPR